MRVLVTGGGGFVGRELVRQIGGRHEVIALDSRLDGLTGIEGDLADPAVLAQVAVLGCDAVVHLATVPGGAAEQDPALAKRVNIDAAIALTDACSQAERPVRFIFASSIAVFGDPLPAHVDDATPVRPKLLYGAHKAMIEEWLAALTRRGALRALSLRLPGIVARPRAPSGMKSAFISNLFHALRADETITLPVSPRATMWLMSVERLASNLVHALETEATGTMTLPALRCTMADLAGEIARACGTSPGLASHAPDAGLEAGFGRQPPLFTPLAESMGFAADTDLAALVGSALRTLA